MKKVIILTLLSVCSWNVHAKVTVADVDRDSSWFAAQNTTIPQSVIDDQWRLYNKPPQEVSNSNRHYQTYSKKCVDFRNSETELKPVAGYTCALTKIGGNYRGYMEVADIIQRAGHWRLKMTCGGADIYATATCWNN